jgi:hypothetical protein
MRIHVGIYTFLYTQPVGNHPFLVLHILQLQMPRQTGHIQLGFFLASSTFSPYLHWLQNVNPKTTQHSSAYTQGEKKQMPNLEYMYYWHRPAPAQI